MKKKPFAIGLTLVVLCLLFAFTACKTETEPPTDTESLAGTEATASESVSTIPTEGEPAAEGLAALVEQIYAEKQVELMLQTNTVDLVDNNAVKTYTGLAEGTKLEEAVVSEAMIGSQAYSMVLVRVKNAADAAAVANEMYTGIDTGKWICVCAEDLSVAVRGDTILLAMCDTELADVVTSAELAEAFKTVMGGTLDLTLSK